MRSLFVIITILLSIQARADLLERINFEDALRLRVQENIRTFDKHASVSIHFDYASFQGELPGTNIYGSQELSPSKLEPSDIRRMSVEIYTELDQVSEEMKLAVYRAIPVGRGKVSISMKKLTPERAEVIKTVEAKDLSEIAERSIETLSKSLLLVVGGLFIAFIAFAFFYASRRVKELKEQFNMLARAISENTGTQMPPSFTQTMSKQDNNNSYGTTDVSALKNIPYNSLKEVFCDSYHCAEDTYANWLWRHIDSQMKTKLLLEVSFMKEYSLFFVDLEATELNHHEHPYYLDPCLLGDYSQKDLAKEVKKTPALWHQLSPMRQQHLPLDIEVKIQAIQSTMGARTLPPLSKSFPRVLKQKTSWGEISHQDELKFFQNPEIIPIHIRENIPSLVWLAHKDNENIQKTLAKFDARSLATAWVGPEEALKKLEQNLPEKKAKLMKTYLEKSHPSRQSSVFLSLVHEGLKDDAA